MRVALISDLHGNLLALDAVLEDVARVGADRIICLGDVATLGPRPRDVLARLESVGCQCILGNHDAFLLEPELIRSYTETQVVVAAVDWCRARLSAVDLEHVRRFGERLTVALGGEATLLCYHGTPRSNTEDLLATTAPEVVDEMLDGCRATVMAGGHTHLQMVRQHRGTLIVNPGSVGMPFVAHAGGGPPTLMAHAEYALVEATAGGGVEVRMRRVAVERSRLREQAEAAEGGFPLREYLVQQYR